MSRTLSVGAVFAAFLLATGCSSTKTDLDGGATTGGATTGGTTGATTTGGTTGGFVDSGFLCHYDIDCAPWHALCNAATPGADGGCSDPLPPDGGQTGDGVSNTCDPDGGDVQPCAVFAGVGNYCTDPVLGSNLCYCHPDQYFDQGGVCYRAIPQCGACTNSIDCGGTQTDYNQGNGSSCQEVGDAGDFCLFNYFGGCERGYSQENGEDGGQVCYPLCNTCPCTPCFSNNDCPGYSHGVCSIATGVCVAPCYTKRDCPGTEVCNIVDKYLNPQDAGLFYGYGQCGPSCAGNGDCLPYETNSPDNPLVCITDRKYPDGGPALDDAGIPITAARCRIDGCINNDECILEVTDAGGNTWCDVWGGNVCTDLYCQIGKDYKGQALYETQCQKGFWCVNDAGLAPQADSGPTHGFCTEAPCYVLDAPLAGCYDNMYCCGWGDGGFWSSPQWCNNIDGRVIDAGLCFTAPPPSCTIGCSVTINDPNCVGLFDIGEPGCFYEGFAGGVNYCEPACRVDWPWYCAAGFSCQPYDANFSYVPIPNNPASLCDPVCGSTQQDGGFTPGDPNANPPRPDVQTCYCPCVGTDVSQCQGLMAPQVFCDSFSPDGGGTCSYGNFCRPGGKGVCAPHDGGL
jgi:hypothetical protein